MCLHVFLKACIFLRRRTAADELFCGQMPEQMRYIPYRSVGKEQGMLTGIVFERMEIFRDSGVLTVEKPVVAVAREPLSADGSFTMLLPEELVI